MMNDKFKLYYNSNLNQSKLISEDALSNYTSSDLSDINIYGNYDTSVLNDWDYVPDDSNNSNWNSVVDNYRLAAEQLVSVRLSNKQLKLEETENTWIPQLELTQQYISAIQELLSLLDANDELSAAKKTELQQLILQLDPEVREAAKSNPYLKEIFHPTQESRTDGYLKLSTQGNIGHTLALDFMRWILPGLEDKEFDYLLNPGNISDIQSKVNEALEDSRLNQRNKVKDIASTIETIHKGNFLFDPTKISEQARLNFKEPLSWNPRTWWNSLGNVGSSYSAFENIAFQTGNAILSNSIVQSAIKSKNAYAIAGAATLALGNSLWIQDYTRALETFSEKFDNYQLRVMELVNSGGMQGEFLNEWNAKKDQLRSFGFNVDNMTEQEIFGAMISTGIRFSDDRINKAIEDAKKGIEVVDLTNAGLQLLDMIEAGMWLLPAANLPKLFRLGTLSKTGVTGNLAQNIVNKEFAASTRSGIFGRVKEDIDDRIVSIAKKMSSNPFKQKNVEKMIKAFGGFAKKSAITSFLESQEEGIQYLVGQQYLKGQYNNVDNYSFVDGLVNDVKLGFEARMAWLGLHNDDALNTDEELMNSMNIGSLIGVVIGNVYNTNNAIRGLKLLTSNNKLAEMYANGLFHSAQDILIDGILHAARQPLSRRSASYRRLKQGLEDIRLGNPEGLSEEVIDKTSQLIDNVYAVDSSPVTKEIAKKLGLKYKNSLDDNTYAMYVKNAVHLAERFSQAKDDAKESEKALNDIRTSLRNSILSDDKSIVSQVLEQVARKLLSESNKESMSIDALATQKLILLDRVIAAINYRMFQQLNSEILNRESDLSKLQEDYKLNVNQDDLHNIRNAILELLQRNKDVQITEELDRLIQQIPQLEEYKQAFAASALNKIVADNLLSRLNAYTLGETDLDVARAGLLWGNLTQEQKLNLISEYEEETQQPVTEQEARSIYEDRMNKEFVEEDEAVNLNRSKRKQLALKLILEDLLRRDSLEKSARAQNRLEQPTKQETVDDNAPVNAQVENTVDLDEESEGQPTVVETPAELPNATELKTDLSNDPNKPDNLPSAPSQPTDEDVMLDKEERQRQKDEIDELDTLLGNSISESVGAEQLTEDTDINRVTDDQDDAIEDNVADTKPEDTQTDTDSQSDLNTVTKDDTETAAEEAANAVLGKQPIPTDDTEQLPKTEDKLDLEERKEDAKLQDIPDQPVITNDIPHSTELLLVEDDKVYFSPTGEMDDAIEIPPELLQMESDFEDTFNSGSAVSSTRVQNDRQYYIENTPGLENSDKLKKNLIGNTFFYRPDANEPLELKVNGKPVTFVTKDGKEAIRGTGAQLAKLLSIPGWLNEIDDVYYIVTDKWSDSRNKSIKSSYIKDLAIHLVIEKDGVVYTTSLRTIDTAKYELERKLNVSPADIDYQLNKLYSLRSSILNKYCPNYGNDGKLPLVLLKDVKPVGLHISNGAISNTSNENGPQYRSVTEVEDFEASDDPITLSELLETGEVEIAYGTGYFTLYDPFSVVSLHTREQSESQGIGYAGKLYIIPKKKNVPSLTTTPPIMLAEELHDNPEFRSRYDIPLAFDTLHRLAEGKTLDDVTSAEWVYELLTWGRFSPEVRFYLLDLLANHGAKTVTHFEGQDELDHYVRKMLHSFVDNKGRLWLQTGAAVDDTKARVGKHRVKYTKVDGISEDARRGIIFNIAKNIHWNTDKELMMSEIPTEVIKYVIDLFNALYIEDGTIKGDANSQVKILGNVITFSLKDVGYTIQEGKIVKDSRRDKAPITLSWMINHKKIKTDVGEHIFDAPFVYATDAIVQERERLNPTSESKSTKRSKVKTTEKSNELKQNELTSEIKQESALENKPNKPEKRKPLKATPENLAKFGLEIPNEELLVKHVWVIGFNVKTGEPKVIQTPIGNAKRLGVYSTLLGKGKLSGIKAKQWLVDKLGLDEKQVRLVNGVMRTLSDDKAFGVMLVVFDRINKEFSPNITLSTLAGRGVEYHEAYHYVSLLLLNELERKKLYSDYFERHNNPNLTIEEAEEGLAEEFRDYMIGIKHTFWNKFTINFFNSLSKFLKLRFLQPSFRSLIFALIESGTFRNSKPSNNILLEFAKAYDSGVHYYVPGLKEELKANLKSITDANTFYDVVEALSAMTLSSLDIRTEEDIYNKLHLNRIYDKIQESLDFGMVSELYVDVVQDVLLNKDVFSEYIKDYLNQLNLTENIQTEEEDVQRLMTETGENNDNTWDINQGEKSKKLSASTAAKLFFYSIPDKKWVLEEDEEGNLIRTIEDVTDSIFGVPRSVPFSIAWNKILEKMWNINSIQELYERCVIEGQTDPFFLAVAERLKSDDKELSEQVYTQLENTIKSSKNSMTTVFFQQDTPNTKYMLNAEDIVAETESAAKRSIWTIQDSSNLRKIATYPKRWSLSFFASDNVSTNSDGVTSISANTILFVTVKLTAIQKLLSTSKRNDIDDLKLIEEIKKEFITLMNQLNIPLDSATFDYVLDSMSSIDSNGNILTKLDKFRSIWNSKDKGGIKSILTNIIRGGKTKSLDKIFTSRNPKSIVNLIAAAYGTVYPSPEEFSVTGADGALIYPISENNYMSDLIRWLNSDLDNKRANILNSVYGSSSVLAKSAGNLKLHTLIAVKNNDSNESKDYFGITPTEDYISKLTLTANGHLVLPTMADKKTWYSITGIDTFDEYLTDQNKFSDYAINVFSNYLISELDTVIRYYNDKLKVADNPSLWRKNYHGAIKDGKMLPNGNGGRMRYFTNLYIGNTKVDINRDLAKLEQNESDESVLLYLNSLRGKLLSENSSVLHRTVNNFLFDLTSREISSLIDMGIIKTDSFNNLSNELLPNNLLKNKLDKLRTYITDNNQFNAESKAIWSLIASHVATEAMSIIEVEKCFTGDPAFYKSSTFEVIYKPNDSNFAEIIGDLSSYIKEQLKINPKFNPNEYASYKVIRENHVDKIKRLSSVLSTGTNLRTNYSTPDNTIPEEDTKYTVLNLLDNQVALDVYNQLTEFFKLDLVRNMYSTINPTESFQDIINKVTKGNVDEILNTFSDSLKNSILKQVEQNGKPYSGTETNQVDAAVYMRPAMWRRVMRSLGEWNSEIEEAYNIIESGDEWMSNPELYRKASKLILNVRKMVYMGDTFSDTLGLDIPVFNKMALFPMFKALCKADNRIIYDRMNNEELGEIDVIAFESAVKVGLTKTIGTYLDGSNTSFNNDIWSKPSTLKTRNPNDLPVQIQSIKHLRLLLNTDPHEAQERSMGTLAVKMVLSNLRDNVEYGTNKGVRISGKELKTRIMQSINELTERGYNKVLNSYFSKDEDGQYYLDENKLSDKLTTAAKQSNMPRELLYGMSTDVNGNTVAPIAALSSRNWIESRIVSEVNRDVVKINTKGGSAVQMPFFGFKSTSAVTQSGAFKPFNGGKNLSLITADGSTEVMLTTNFFRHVIPVEYLGTFQSIRYYLKKHNIIGPSSKPYGIGYRIPTQGSSSTFSFKVMDVLPSTFADTIVVPDGFTSMTGSDFDIDKLYLGVLEYDQKGKLIQYDETKAIDKQSDAAIKNRLIQLQLMCISDEVNMAETKASIDTLTSILKKKLLPIIVPTLNKEALPGYGLLPSFLLSRKFEYSTGKSGIAPFALQSTNHALTLATHLTMRYSDANKYDIGLLDAIYGRDGYRILDWLSAMINAHVDVAKDPYIIALNVNQATYNTCCLLLRGGFGETTFMFLAQDILKEYANLKLSANGMYRPVSGINDRIITNKLRKIYFDRLYRVISAMPNGEEKNVYMASYDELLGNNTSRIYKRFNQYYDTFADILHKDVFDPTVLSNAFKLDKNSTDYLITQIRVLNVYSDLSKDAQKLARLVKMSLIDTEKFGNNLMLLLNFMNSMKQFLDSTADSFYINTDDQITGKNAILKYMQDTFLLLKYNYGLSLPRQILKSQQLTATDEFALLFTQVMKALSVDDTQSDYYGYTNDAEKILNVCRNIESLIKGKLVGSLDKFNRTPLQLRDMFQGTNSICRRLLKIKQYIIQNLNILQDLVDTSTGTILNDFINYLNVYPADGNRQILDRIVLYNSSLNSDIETESRLISAFDQLINHQDDTIRLFAEDLAVYAFYISYDNPNPNGFFNLVPLNWKILNGYVGAIKDTLLNGIFANILESTDSIESNNIKSVVTLLARNNWMDEYIVPTYNRDRTDTVIFGSTSNPTTFVSRNNSTMFIKTRNGNDVNLYMKVGSVMVRNNDSERVLRYTEHGIYTLIPKLGIYDGSQHVMEYNVLSTGNSVFPWNNLTNDLVKTMEDILAQLNLLENKLCKLFTRDYSEKNSYSLAITTTNNNLSDFSGSRLTEFEDLLYEDYVPIDNSITESFDVDVNSLFTDLLLTEDDITTAAEINEQLSDNNINLNDLVSELQSELEDVTQTYSEFEQSSEDFINDLDDIDMSEDGKEIKKQCNS